MSIPGTAFGPAPGRPRAPSAAMEAARAAPASPLPARRRAQLAAVLAAAFGTRRAWLWGGAGLAALTVVMGMALLGLSGWFIAATAIAGLQAASAIVFDVFMPSAGIRLLALGRTGARYAERLVTHDAALAALAALRQRLFLGWARPQAARQLLRRPARLLFRLTADLDALESLYLRCAVPLAAAVGGALFAGGLLAFVDPWLGLGLWMALMAIGAALVLATLRAARAPAARRALAVERLRERAVDLLAGQTELVMAGRLRAQREALARADARLARHDDRLHRIDTRAGLGFGLAGTAILVGVLLAVGALAERGTIGAPVAALALLVALTATEPFAALRRGALEAGRTWLAVGRLAPRLDGPNAAAAEVDAASPLPAPPPGGALQLRAASLRHDGARQAALDGITLHVADGERVALVGPSGAGKSSLLALATGELRACGGTVHAHRATWLTQRTELFQDSLRENLRLARPQADDAALWDALEAAGLASDVRAMHRGLDTPLGEGGLGLSGGQARRLALARMLCGQGLHLWVVDEPTEGLDTATAHDVLRRLAARAHGRTLLIATHWRREAALAERIVRIEGGRIVADERRGSAACDALLDGLRQD